MRPKMLMRLSSLRMRSISPRVLLVAVADEADEVADAIVLEVEHEPLCLVVESYAHDDVTLMVCRGKDTFFPRYSAWNLRFFR